MNRVAPRVEKQSRAQKRRATVAPVSRVGTLSDSGWFWVIFGCAFFVRLLYLIEINSIPLFYHLAGDGRTYYEWGQKIAAGDWLGHGVFYQAPLYPYFLGFLQAVFGPSVWLIRLIQIVLGAISCALIFEAGRNLFSLQAGIAAGLILAFYAPGIFFDGLIEKSIIDFFLVAVFVANESRESYGGLAPVARHGRRPGSFGPFPGKRAHPGCCPAVLDGTLLFPVTACSTGTVDRSFLCWITFGAGCSGAEKSRRGRRVQTYDIAVRSQFFYRQ
jgi:hypothetical protein